MVLWITLNERLQHGITLINAISTSKFSLLLKHIIQAQNVDTFTSEELKKLEESLNLKSNQLQLLLHSIIYIFKQSSKVILKPTVLQKQLTEELKFKSDKAEEFVKIWTNETKKNFENLEDQQRLNKISWELNVQTASSFSFKETVPTSRLQLGLMNKNSEKENITVELNENELLQLYATLENIQTKLDSIQNANK